MKEIRQEIQRSIITQAQWHAIGSEGGDAKNKKGDLWMGEGCRELNPEQGDRASPFSVEEH